MAESSSRRPSSRRRAGSRRGTVRRAAGRRTPRRRTRAPDATRTKLLQAAFEEMYRRGFQATSLDTILARAGVTKGALYHHFPDKAALGHAVVDEVIAGLLLTRWLDPLAGSDDPLTALAATLKEKAAVTNEKVLLGCPLNNLAQEMAPVDEPFRRRVNATFDAWREGFAGALERGKAAGTLRPDVDTRKVAGFIVAAIEGSFGVAKGARSARMLRDNIEVLTTLLETLRPVADGRR